MTHELLVSLEPHDNPIDRTLHDRVRAAFPKEDMSPDGTLFFSQIIPYGRLRWRVVSFSGTDEEIPAGIYVETNLSKDTPIDSVNELMSDVFDEFNERVALMDAMRSGSGVGSFQPSLFSVTEMGMCFEVKPAV